MLNDRVTLSSRDGFPSSWEGVNGLDSLKIRQDQVDSRCVSVDALVLLEAPLGVVTFLFLSHAEELHLGPPAC